MEKPLTLNPLSIQDENSVVHRKKVTADGKSKTSIPLAKKGGVARESRKALNDITNKSSVHREETTQRKKQFKVVENGYLNQQVFESKKKISVNEKLNIAEEGFLHDHTKCIDAQKSASSSSQLNFWDTVLPGHGDDADLRDLIMEQPKVDPDNCYLELEEVSMPDWFKRSWKSPPPSPLHRDCHLPSHSAWEFEEVELVLKEDEDCDV